MAKESALALTCQLMEALKIIFSAFSSLWCLITGISFTPTEVGDHWVSIFRNGQPIPKSPFKIVIGTTELGNASKVRVGGRGLTQGMVNELSEFFVNTKDAGMNLIFWHCPIA